MISYYVSTIDRHLDGPRKGQMKTDSNWSSDMRNEARDKAEALENETLWLAEALEQDWRTDRVFEVDAKAGTIEYMDIYGDEYVQEVSIDEIEEV